MKEVLSKIKKDSIELIISDLDDTLVKNIAVSFFKSEFKKHPLKNLAFIANTFYNLLKYAEYYPHHFSDFEIKQFDLYLDKYSSLDEVVEFVINNKENLILKDAQEFLSYFPDTKKVLVTSDFKEIAELFKDDFQLDEIYAGIKYKDEAIRNIVNPKYHSVLVLGDSFKDLEMIFELKNEGIEPLSIFRSKDPEIKEYVSLEITSFYSLL